MMKGNSPKKIHEMAKYALAETKTACLGCCKSGQDVEAKYTAVKKENLLILKHFAINKYFMPLKRGWNYGSE